MRMGRIKKPRAFKPAGGPDSPWLCAVARATRVHRAELSQRGRARRTINHAGSARANTTSGPVPLLSPPGNRRSLLSGAKRRQWKSQNTPTTETDATCASPASVLHRDSQPRLKSASEHSRTQLHAAVDSLPEFWYVRVNRTPEMTPNGSARSIAAAGAGVASLRVQCIPGAFLIDVCSHVVSR